VEDELGYDGRRQPAAREEHGAREDQTEYCDSLSEPKYAEDAPSTQAAHNASGHPGTQVDHNAPAHPAAQVEDELGYAGRRQPAAREEHGAQVEQAAYFDSLSEPTYVEDAPGTHAADLGVPPISAAEPDAPDTHAPHLDAPGRVSRYDESAARLEPSAYADDEDEPTSFIPVVEAEPEGRPELLSGPVVDVAAAVRMSIPGLGLVGADGPRIASAPGSIEEAMRSEVERPRPRPHESDAFKALHAWCKARTAVVPSGFTIQVQVLDPGHPSYRFDLEPPDVDDPEFGADKLSGLLGDLWISEASGSQGGWLFARIDAAGRTLRIDRWYDQVPDWWDNPVESRLDVHGLVRRLHDRGPEWQPSYLERLYTTAR